MLGNFACAALLRFWNCWIFCTSSGDGVGATRESSSSILLLDESTGEWATDREGSGIGEAATAPATLCLFFAGPSG